MKINKFYTLMFCFLNPYIIYSQDLIYKGANITEDSSVTSAGSTVKSHIEKFGILPNGDEFSCGLNYSEPNRIYTVNQQTDLVYYESYSDTSYLKIKSQGYYRLVYVNGQIGYCWKKDLIWNVFDDTGKLSSIYFYNKGEIIKVQ